MDEVCCAPEPSGYDVIREQALMGSILVVMRSWSRKLVRIPCPSLSPKYKISNGVWTSSDTKIVQSIMLVYTNETIGQKRERPRYTHLMQGNR